MRYLRLVLVTIACFVGAACGESPIQPSQGPGTPTPTSLLLPPIHGIVREVNGGPIANARIILRGTNSSPTDPSVNTNLNGEFELQSSNFVCRSPGIGHLFVSSSGYFSRQIRTPACTAIPEPPVWTTVIALQKVLSVAEDSVVETVLSNDNLDWGSPETAYYEYPCGPCILITLPSVMTAQWEVTVEWSSNDRLSAWFEGLDNDYDTVKLGEYASAPGESRITVLMPKAWREYLYPLIKIGLPAGARNAGGLPNAITVNVKLRKVE